MKRLSFSKIEIKFRLLSRFLKLKLNLEIILPGKTLLH
nr:MAG TPA: hypothetical protein [Caudoviricetes sp.]